MCGEGIFLGRVDFYDYRTICLVFACMTYAVFGSPTPDNIGVAEVVIGILLALSIGAGRAHDVFIKSDKTKFWKSSGQVFLIYGMSIPILAGAVYGNGFSAMLRDIIPFLFLFLPMFLLPLLRARPYYFRSILFAILMIGLLFALRSLMMRIYDRCLFACPDELLYLENMPTVLFACLLIIGVAMSFIMRGVTMRNIAIFSALIMVSLIPIVAMVTTLQRASLGAVALYVVILQCYFFYKSPAKAALLFLIGTLFVFIINISFSSVFYDLLSKTQNVGLNMRPQEFVAIWDIVSGDPLAFLFGIGWGGQFYSPAVGGLSVNFTHNFFTTLLLKTGIIGVVACIAYIVGLLERLLRVIFKNPILGLALAAPILIDLTLYASFKSLDFGLVLLLISGSLVYLRDYNNES